MIRPHGPYSGEMVPYMLINESGCQTRSRLTEKLEKCEKMRMHHTSYMAASEEKQIDSLRIQNGMTNVFLRRESFGG